MEFEKINDVAVADPVIEVSESACQDQAERTLQQAIPSIAAEAVHNYSRGRDGGYRTQQEYLDGRTERGKNAECNSRILHIRYVK